MPYIQHYTTPPDFDDLLMSSDGKVLTGLWFSGSRDERKHTADCVMSDLHIFKETTRWLDIYFGGRQPDFTPAYRMENLTQFRSAVVEIMIRIQFGKTLTYGEIARQIAAERNCGKMSAQAVGGAVGWNPICIIVPCHRVIGANNQLIGYGGGINNKIALLKLEGIDV